MGTFSVACPDMLTVEFLGEALDSAPDAIIITDSSGRILFANARVPALLGYDVAEIVGESIEKLLPQRLRTPHVKHRGRYYERPAIRPMGSGLELAALRKDGTEVPVEISLSPIKGTGERQFVAAALRDATERRRARQELIEAREAADRANQSKSRFLSTASHDLRQPLQTLALLNGALRRLVEDPTATEALAHQDQAIAAMSRLVNALLDISKLESGAIRPDLTDFAVGPLFEELRREFAGLAASKGLELRIAATEDYARSDRALVGQVLRNLVSNAVKYTARGWVQLRCTSARDGVHIEVQDTGIGIPADQLTQIYEEFYQVGVASNTSREGYGLGLSIVRRLVELLRLRIEVHSEPAQGSTFTLYLPHGTPMAGESVGPGTSADIRRAPPPGPLILLVDDDAGVRSATAMLLRVEGYRVVLASSLTEGLAHAKAATGIALLISDYHLREGETGVQVIAAVRAALGRDVPAVLITGDTSSTMRHMYPDEHVHLASKPIDAEQLLGLLRTLLSH